jgi:hypothetical protein
MSDRPSAAIFHFRVVDILHLDLASTYVHHTTIGCHMHLLFGDGTTRSGTCRETACALCC